MPSTFRLSPSFKVGPSKHSPTETGRPHLKEFTRGGPGGTFSELCLLYVMGKHISLKIPPVPPPVNHSKLGLDAVLFSHCLHWLRYDVYHHDKGNNRDLSASQRI